MVWYHRVCAYVYLSKTHKIARCSPMIGFKGSTSRDLLLGLVPASIAQAFGLGSAFYADGVLPLRLSNVIIFRVLGKGFGTREALQSKT